MKRSPINRVSKKKRSADQLLRQVRVLVLERAAGMCECGCERPHGPSPHVHHILRRSQGGGHDPANLLVLSAQHHAWVHEHIQDAIDRGLLARSH